MAVQPPWLLGVSPYLPQCEWGRVAERERDLLAAFLLFLWVSFLTLLGVILFWGLKSKGCESALLLLGSELLPNH